MTTPAILWPVFLGLGFLIAGLILARRRAYDDRRHDASRLSAFGPTFVGAALAAFAGVHFTAAASIAQLVPAFLPAPLAIAYFVGVAHLAVALSFVTRRYVVWSSMGLAVMFALFVLLMDLPAAISRPSGRLGWILAARQSMFSIGALALFATETKERLPHTSSALVMIARFWTAGVLVFYGVDHLLHPALTPGVPSNVPIAAWIPLSQLVVYVTGILLVACGTAMLVTRVAGAAAARCGELMTLLTVVLYVPQFFIAHEIGARATAVNFVFDTLLFAGTMLLISNAMLATKSVRLEVSRERADGRPVLDVTPS